MMVAIVPVFCVFFLFSLKRCVKNMPFSSLIEKTEHNFLRLEVFSTQKLLSKLSPDRQKTAENFPDYLRKILPAFIFEFLDHQSLLEFFHFTRSPRNFYWRNSCVWFLCYLRLLDSNIFVNVWWRTLSRHVAVLSFLRKWYTVYLLWKKST